MSRTISCCSGRSWSDVADLMLPSIRLFWLRALLTGFCACLGFFSLHQTALSQDLGAALGSLAKTFPCRADKITWSPEGQHLLVICGGVMQSHLKSFDLQSGTQEWDNPNTFGDPIKPEYIENGALIVTEPVARGIHPDGTRGCFGECKSLLSIIDARSGQLVRRLDDPQPNPNGQASAGAPPWDLRLSHESPKTLAISYRSSSGIYAAGYDVLTWTRRWLVGPLTGADRVNGILFDSTRKSISVATATAYFGASIETWDIASNKHLQKFRVCAARQSAMLLNWLSGHVITGCGDTVVNGIRDDDETSINAWDPISGALALTYSGPGGSVADFALTSTGKYLVATRERNSIAQPRKEASVVIWEAETGRLVQAANYGQHHLNSVAFSPDDRQLAVSFDQTVQIINLNRMSLR